MTVRIDLAEAQGRLLELINAAIQSDAVIITQNQRPLVQILAIGEETLRPQFGSARGLIEMIDDFDAPIEEFSEFVP